MPKYVTLDWNEYNRLVEEKNQAVNRSRDFGWFRSELISLVLTPEEDHGYYNFLGPLPPVGWEPISNEEIVKRIKEKYGK